MADQIYQTLCAALDARGYHYDKDETKRSIRCTLKGRDIPITFMIVVNDSRKLIEFVSVLPCKMPEDKRIDGAIATTIANFGMYDGTINYNIKDGILMYRMTSCFKGDTKVGQGLFHYMIDCGCTNVDRYNDRFYALAEGIIDIQKFVEME